MKPDSCPAGKVGDLVWLSTNIKTVATAADLEYKTLKRTFQKVCRLRTPRWKKVG